jgi:hypothetical protein
MNNDKPKIFLSYAHIDLGFAKKIYCDLQRYGLDIWFDKESLLPGQDWENEIKYEVLAAIQPMEQFHHDVIFLDNQMPGVMKNGLHFESGVHFCIFRDKRIGEKISMNFIETI